MALNPELGYSDLEPSLFPPPFFHLRSFGMLFIKYLPYRQPEMIFPVA